MPNYKLGKSLASDLMRGAMAMTERKIDYAQSGFPLTPDEIQRATISPELVASIEYVKNHTNHSVSGRTSNVYMTLERGKLPGLERTMVFRAMLPASIYVARGQYSSLSLSRFDAPAFDTEGDSCLIIDPARVVPDKLTALAAWANDLGRAHRIRDFISHVVYGQLRRYDCTGSILANWPMLATLTDDALWRGRFRAPPGNLKRYVIPTTVEDRRDMLACEGAMLGAQIMQKFASSPHEARCVLLGLERRSTDRYKAVAAVPRELRDTNAYIIKPA